MLKFANLSLSQKRFVVAVLNHDKQYKKVGQITLKECAAIYYTLRDQRTGVKGEKVGYPNWLFNKNKVERGVYQLPLPTEVDMTNFEKQIADKKTKPVAKAKAKVVKLQQAKQAKVAKLQQAKVDKLQQAKVVKTNTPAKTAEQKEGQLEMSRLQKIIDDSAEVDTDVEEFNTILKQNGIKI